MRFRLISLLRFHVLGLVLISGLSRAAEPVSSKTCTLYVSGLECGSCVYVVQQAVSETTGVVDVSVTQGVENHANVTFDPRQLSEHQLAQAVREALPIHGTPYLATLKLSVPDYAENASQVDQLFSTWKGWVSLEVLNAKTGELAVHFQPLKIASKQPGPQGWSLTTLTEAMHKLGLQFNLIREAI